MLTIERIQALLKQRNLTQQEFCAEIGIKPQVYTDWKAGRNKSYIKYIDRIAQYFDVSVDYLLGQKKTSSEEDEKINTVKIWMRGGSREVKLSDEQMEAIAKLLDTIKPEN